MLRVVQYIIYMKLMWNNFKKNFSLIKKKKFSNSKKVSNDKKVFFFLFYFDRQSSFCFQRFQPTEFYDFSVFMLPLVVMPEHRRNIMQILFNVDNLFVLIKHILIIFFFSFISLLHKSAFLPFDLSYKYRKNESRCKRACSK